MWFFKFTLGKQMSREAPYYNMPCSQSTNISLEWQHQKTQPIHAGNQHLVGCSCLVANDNTVFSVYTYCQATHLQMCDLPHLVYGCRSSEDWHWLGHNRRVLGWYSMVTILPEICSPMSEKLSRLYTISKTEEIWTETQFLLRINFKQNKLHFHFLSVILSKLNLPNRVVVLIKVWTGTIKNVFKRRVTPFKKPNIWCGSFSKGSEQGLG